MCPVEVQRKIFYDNRMIDIFITSNYCLLVDIDRRRNKWNPTIFESEGEFQLQESQKKYVW